MIRDGGLAVAALAVGAAGLAAWFGVRCVGSRPAAWEAKAAEHAVSAEATPAAAQPAAAQPAPTSDLDTARQLLADGKKYEARALLTKLILAAPEGPDRETLRQMLETINKDLFFSNKTPSPDCASYTVLDGDTLSAIANSQGKDLYFSEVIMLVNGISDARRIRPRQTLKIPQGKFSAIVQKGPHRVIILLADQYIKEYPVALGTPATPTPEGQYVIDTKAVNPDWTAPDGQVYKFNDPKNILGTRWMGFKDTPEHQGLGIHGTSEPASIGTDASNGCVRMLNHDVEEIFGMLAPGDTVEVRK